VFRIKICGVTTPEDARLIAESGADAVGLNFFPESPRYVSPERAAEIAAQLPKSIVRVGVFVNASSAVIRAAAELAGLDLIQLHGDEPPEFLRELAPLPVLRAFRTRGDLKPIGDYLKRCVVAPRAVLLDAYQPGSFGGTGQTLNWHDIRASKRRLGELPLVLAGGLNPRNVAQAIRTVQPAAVDVASGVEAETGRKDPRLVAEFVESAQLAFDG
jgi:phosphoribosylanthranilate isomerase